MTDPTTASPAASGAGREPDRRRRRFLGAGAAVTPGVLSLASTPALGVTCFTPSRSLSKNTSVSQAGKNGECTADVSPALLAGDLPSGNSDTLNNAAGTYWPANTRTIQFHNVFSGARFKNPNGSNETYRQIIEKRNTSVAYGLAAYMVAAHINILRLKVDSKAMDLSRLKTIWAEWEATGFYTPMAGVPKWDASAIIAYLSSNGIVKSGL